MKLVIARHAETNKAANLPGESDALSPAGHSQVENLIKICRTENVEVVFHSTQPRSFFITHWGSIRALLPIIKNEPKESTLDLNVEFGQAFVADY